ncbi:hypothetical protein SAMN05421847_1799 [Halpernia humi]|uniref:Uncharacterized protein n=1 Tax=Halpernia humi TaxID=493375 RepID=A0A1H5YPN1_9FLAO|nr:hypothetical protein [Halpernia humi]SEG25642.1 hypothetical protein SAMN05421847_1799 [Halpernia humi]
MKKLISSPAIPVFVVGLFLWAFAFILKKILRFSDNVFISVFIFGLVLELIGLILIIKIYKSKRKKR